MKGSTAVFLVLAGPSTAMAQASRVTAPAERALLTRLVAVEDSRDTVLTAADPRRQGLASPNAFVRAFTVRGLGRLESPSVMPMIAPLLADSSAEVRAAAADAMAQSTVRFPASAATARNELVAHFAGASSEREPVVRAALAEAIGRLAPGSVDQVKVTALLIAPSLRAASVIEARGAIRGIFFLTRKREARAAGTVPVEVTDRMFAMLTDASQSALSPIDRLNIGLALGWAVALDDGRAAILLDDRDPNVRDRGVAALSRSTDTAKVHALVSRALYDPAPIVRFRAVGVYAQKLRAANGCGPLLAAAHDVDVTVALAATDALSGCRGDSAVTRFLDSAATALRDGDRWHIPAHAFVSLSVVDSASARALMPRYAGAKNFYIRMMADTAARLMRDLTTLRILAGDSHPNVRTSAVAALSRLVGHAADSIFVAALASDDNQLLMAVAAALEGSPFPGVLDSMASAARRVALLGDTHRDGFQALTGKLPPAIRQVIADPAPDRIHLPDFAELAELEAVTGRIEMADGSVITMRFHPFDAPTNVSRFVRLARAGTFDGLGFHRVAPFFVVQGPSPFANEYAAPDRPFARDELGLQNVRGSVGLSTRGRDTADGQIYINTVDNTWLDHEYTVMATITSGLAAFDRMQEGARIRRITITR